QGEQVEGAVVPQVGDRDGERVGAGGIGSRGLEGPVAVAQQHIDVAQGIYDDQVQLVVAVEVGQCQPERSDADAKGADALEGSVTVAQKNADGLVAGIGHHEVRFAVTVEVAGQHTLNAGAGGQVAGERQRGRVGGELNEAGAGGAVAPVNGRPVV